MNKSRKILIITSGLILGLFLFYQLGKAFGPGSYPNAEIYEIKAPEQEVVKAINNFKKLNPEYVVPKVNINNNGSFDLSESEGRKEKSQWNFNYFFYKNENEIIFTWTRPNLDGNTDLAFVSLNKGLNIGNWKDINHDFGFFENRKLKEEFESRILKPIKKLIK
ncbi:hypothetical protein [Flavobacterium wongokense]|uniref:hypothetical protein n=1 Tax=Flavobacterium wongokense TaxID=2910674 RepID=UPI001F3821C2|nr:hypothetical protein [Flavobacterium sp. WG47]MCF6133453.1 hypothetical protein [Flavobacterium sp. WG47]